MLCLNPEIKARVLLDFLFFLIQALCIIGLFTADYDDYMRMAIGNVIFWISYIIIEHKFKWKIPIYIRLITIISIISNDVLGDFLNLYVLSAFYDRLQHIFGTYSLTLWAYFVIQQFIKTKFTQKKFIIIFILSLSMALGTLYEIVEFFLDEFTNPEVKNQPSLLDTDLDLISDFAGGIIALLHYLFSKSLKSFTFPFEKR
jgi:hypothetical protein